MWPLKKLLLFSFFLAPLALAGCAGGSWLGAAAAPGWLSRATRSERAEALAEQRADQAARRRASQTADSQHADSQHAAFQTADSQHQQADPRAPDIQAAGSRRDSAASPPSARDRSRSLDHVLDQLEVLREEDPAKYEAVKEVLSESSGELSPEQQRYLPVLAAALTRREEMLAEPAQQPATARTSAAPSPAPQASETGGTAVSESKQLESASSDSARASIGDIEEERPVEPALERQPALQPEATRAKSVGEQKERSEDQGQPHESEPGDWHETLDAAIDQLEKELVDSELDKDELARLEAYLRLLYVVDNQREKAVGPIDPMDEDVQLYWKHQLYALLVSLDADDRHARSRRAALALRDLRTAADHLANISALDVRNLAFCKKVDSYGRYVEFAPYTFDAGQEVLLYVEVENFAAEPVQQEYETELHGEYTILDENTERVASVVLPLDKQVCNNRRRDYFIAYRLYLPSEIREGEYTLVLTMEDVKGHKSNQASIDFRIR